MAGHEKQLPSGKSRLNRFLTAEAAGAAQHSRVTQTTPLRPGLRAIMHPPVPIAIRAWVLVPTRTNKLFSRKDWSGSLFGTDSQWKGIRSASGQPSQPFDAKHLKRAVETAVAASGP